MTYLSAKRESRKKWIMRGSIIFLILVVSIFWPRVRTTLSFVYDPLLEAYSMTHGYFSNESISLGAYFKSKKSLENYISNLEKENEALTNKVALLTYGSTTNQISSTTSESSGAIIAYPILSSLSSLYHTLRISKGFADGVEADMVAYGRGRQALGYVQEVSGHSALVLLFSSPGYEVAGVLERTGAVVDLIGNGGGSYIIVLPKSIDIVVGDRVLFGSDETFTLGTVADVVSVKQDVAQRVYVRGGYNPSELRTLYVQK